MSRQQKTAHSSSQPEVGGSSPSRSPQLIRRPSSPPRRGYRLVRWAMVGLIGLVVLLAAAPSIVGKTALGDWLIRQWVPTEWGTVEIAQRDLNWWQPVSVQGVRLTDGRGELLAEIGSLRTKETLWQILWHRSLTDVQVAQAAVRMHWRADGSNWEDWIATLVRDQPPVPDRASPGLPDVSIRFEDCQVVLDSQTDGQRWLVENLSGQVDIRQQAENIMFQTQGDLKDMDQNLAAGRCQATVLLTDQAGLRSAREQWQLSADDLQSFQVHTTTGGLAFLVQLDGMATSLGRSVLRRFLPDLECSGLATGQVAGVCNWYGDYVHVATPKLVIDRLVLGEPSILAGDQIRMQQFEATGAIASSPTGLSVQRVKVAGDYLRSDLDGRLDYDQVLNALATRRLPSGALSSTGTVNLAHLANQLPQTLQLQQDLDLEQGNLTWQIFNRPEGDGSQRLFVDMVAKNLAGRRGSSQVQWPEPIQISGSVRDYNRPVTFDHLDVRSDFLQASARPQADGGTQVNFQLNFDRLRTALEQFFQLPPVVLQGKAEGQATWQMLARDGRLASLTEPATGMAFNATVGLSDAHVAVPEFMEIREPNLRLNLGTRMQWGNPKAESQGLWAVLATDADVTVEAARIELTSQLPPGPGGGGLPIVAQPGALPGPGLGLLVQLKQPVHLPRLNQVLQYLSGAAAPPANAADAPVLEADVAVSGPLDEWLAMVRPLLVGVDVALTGSFQGKFQLSLNQRFALVSQLQGSSQQFGFRGFGVGLHEPIVQVAGAASYHYANGLIHTEDFWLTGNSLAVRAMKTRLQWGSLNRRLEGEFLLTGDVARLWHTYQWMQVAGAADEPPRLGAVGGDRLPSRDMAPQPEFDQIQLVGHVEGYQPVGEAEVVFNLPEHGGPSPLGMGGILKAKINLRTEDETLVHVDWDAQVADAWIGSQQPNGAWVAWLKEPTVDSKGTARLPLDLSRVDLPNVTVNAQSLRGAVAGRVHDLPGVPQVELRGQIEMAAMEWLRQFAGPEMGNLEINGLQNHQFEVAGPLSLQQVQGRWITQWQEIRWLGLRSGPADVVVHLQQGIARMVPLRFAAGGGQIHLAPEVDLRRDPVWIRLPRGVIFDQVQLTPEICRNFLKYSAPLLAEVTSVQGSFSLDSDGIEVPLSDWTKLVAKARVTINGARVGPGPLGIQIGNIASTLKAVADGQAVDAAGLEALGLGSIAHLAPSGDGQRTRALNDLAGNVLGSLGSGQPPTLQNLLPGQTGSPGSPPGTDSLAGASGTDNLGSERRQAEVTWLEIPAQTISVNLQDGAVVHDRLTMTIRGFEFQSQGRVGLDQSVALQTQLSLPAELLEKNPQLASALGPNIQLPVTGTLTRPALQAGQLRTALNTAFSQGLQQKLGTELEKRLGIGVPGGTTPLPEVLQQGQRQLEETLNEKLKLPSGTLDPAQRLFNRGLEQGRQRLWGGGN